MNNIWYVLAVNKRHRERTIFFVAAVKEEKDVKDLFKIYLLENKLEYDWFDVTYIDGEETDKSGIILVDQRIIHEMD